MPVPIICLDEHVRQFAERFRHEFSKPQYQYLVIVLLGLMLCKGTRTLRGLVSVADLTHPNLPVYNKLIFAKNETHPNTPAV